MKNEVVDIFDISYDGAGVGKIDGQIVFVPKTLKGETVSIKIVKQTSKFLIGEKDEVLKESSSRTAAPCPYFEICGGCDFQNCDYETEIETKKLILSRELEKAGYFGTIDFEKSPKRFYYRNKIKLEVQNGQIGYFKPKSHNFFPVSKCLIASEKINNAIDKIVAFLASNNFKYLKNVYIKEFRKSIGICFLFDRNCKINAKNAKNIEILTDFDVFFAFGEILESDKTKIFSVFKNIKNASDELNLENQISAFTQVNNEVSEKLYDFILKNCENKRVVNAYSGQGALTLKIADKAKFVYGIEYQRAAHDVAEEFKKQRKDYKIENICGKVEENLQNILNRDRIDLIILDPAREGCQKVVLDALNNSQINEIIYVSCNFSTLIRDLKILNEHFETNCIKIFDMFPCTANLETVAVLHRK